MNDELSKTLQKLDDFLSSDAVDDEAMLLSQLDGLLAGVIVSPDLIQPSEWLPLVWGEEAPLFATRDQAQGVFDLIMAHYNDVIRELDSGCYSPIYNLDRDGSALWEIWIDGFWQAMCLRADAWTALDPEEDEDLEFALFVLGRLTELALRPEDFEAMESDETLEKAAPDLIPSQVEVLHRARLARAKPFMTAASTGFPKVGRNDPCPCGSGKKFKKCCLH